MTLLDVDRVEIVSIAGLDSPRPFPLLFGQPDDVPL